jgi:predicted nuclease of predicted toxin-antitoxin system
MQLVADESCDAIVVRALRAAGHDVLAVAEVAPGADDSVVIDLARRAGRMLLTEDKDFGQLVYASGRPTAGVLLLRYPATARQALAADVVRLVGHRRRRLAGRFVVIQPGRVRLGALPARVRTNR